MPLQTKPGIELRHRHERVSKHLMSQKGSDRVRVTRKLRTNLSGHGKKPTKRTHLLETAEEGDTRTRNESDLARGIRWRLQRE